MKDWWINGGFMSDNRSFGRGRGRQDKMCACDARENWKIFENCLRFNPICTKHMIFAIQLTHEQVAKTSLQNPVTKILKILSKSFSRLVDPLVRKSQNLLCKLVTGASTHDQVTKMTHENGKNPEIFF